MVLINFEEWNLEEKKCKIYLFPLRTQLKLYCPCGSFIRTGHFNQCFRLEMHCMQERPIRLVCYYGPNNRGDRQRRIEQVPDGISD